MTTSTDDRQTRADAEPVAAAPPDTAPLGPSEAAPIPDDALVILPVRNVVLFPGIALPLTLGRPRSIAAAQEAARTERPVGVVLQRMAEVDEPAPDQLHRVGTAAGILRYITAPDGSHHVVCQGQQRFRVLEYLPGYPYLVARIERLEESEAEGKEIEARFLHLKQRAIEALGLLPQVPPELVNAVQSVTSPAAGADFVANFMDLPPEEKQAVLETLNVQRRLDRVLEKLGERIEVLKITRDISQQTKESMEGHQREFSCASS